MKHLGTSLVIEKKAFMLFFEKGKFRFEPYDNGISLSKHLRSYIDDYLFDTPFSDILGLKSSFLNTFEIINIADDLEKQYISSQTVRKKSGIVYLISDGEYVKIGGTSYNVPKRLLELQTGNARKLSVIGRYQVDYMVQSERMVQHKYKDRNVLNEWYKLSESQINKILSDRDYFYPSDNIKSFSLITKLNIMHAQYTLINDEMSHRIKLLKRLKNKLNNTPNHEFLIKLRSRNFTSHAVKSYLFKKYNYQKNEKLVYKINKDTTHVEKLREYSTFLAECQLLFMDQNNIYYSDDEGIYRDSTTNESIEDHYV